MQMIDMCYVNGLFRQCTELAASHCYCRFSSMNFAYVRIFVFVYIIQKFCLYPMSYGSKLSYSLQLSDNENIIVTTKYF